MNEVKIDKKFTLQTDNKITTNSRAWLRDGLQIHYAGVQISLRSPIWAIRFHLSRLTQFGNGGLTR